MNKNNVLLINVDHWFNQLLGCNGHETIMTPTLDSLARDGVVYDNCYSECPVCIPARRTLMTGTTPRTHGDRVYADQMPMPEGIPTMAETFKKSGYQTFAVGKLHVYPQRDRIGFDDALILEEGRYDFGVVDDYQIWLGEQGYVGKEFYHGMGNNTYYTRPFHLPEEAHPTNWVTAQAIKQIKRKDPTKPGFFYVSYQAPHPPLVPLQIYLDMYSDHEIDASVYGTWLEDGNYAIDYIQNMTSQYSEKEILMAKKAFYALCTHVDQQIRLLIGTLREMNLLDKTVIMFLSDHGDMLFDHHMVAKRCFYERATNIPLILSGKPVESMKGTRDSRLVALKDIMPTLLGLCDIDMPSSVEGKSILGKEKYGHIYGEVGTGIRATRMIRMDQYKLIYYASGNKFQLFDLANDPREMNDLIDHPNLSNVAKKLKSILENELYGSDLEWYDGSTLVGLQDKTYQHEADYGMYNQRGGHWPSPNGYNNKGTNA